jgi:hypothetical protein
MRLLSALILMMLAAGPTALAEENIWCTANHTPGAIPMFTKTVRGSFISGNALYDNCEPTALPTCGAYIFGVLDLMAQTNGQLFAHCLPDKATGKQLIDVVVKWLRENPAERHYSAASNIQVALQQAFPCDLSTPP